MSADPFDPVNMAMRSLHQGNVIAAKDARIKQLEERLEGMREAGDQLWYCVRHAQRIHADELVDALEEWQEARNHA